MMASATPDKTMGRRLMTILSSSKIELLISDIVAARELVGGRELSVGSLRGCVLKHAMRSDESGWDR